MSELDPALLAILACPKCKGKLEAAAGALRCAPCGKTYPVKDGIPDFLP